VSLGKFRQLVAVVAIAAWTCLACFGASAAQPPIKGSENVLRTWHKVILELVRHTPTYTPPVASRSFAYLGVTAYESVASGDHDMQSLAGQLNGLQAVPKRESGKSYDEAVIMHSALNAVAQDLFANTGPTGQRVLGRLDEKIAADVSDGLPADVVERSDAYGRAVAANILEWSRSDGGAIIENMGFPYEYKLAEGPANWIPTSLVSQQQKPLLPDWGKNRTFAMPNGASCPLPPPPAYSEDKASEFYKQALEVYDAKHNLTPEQRAIARFWSDDPMLSPTPPGHWLSIALQILERENADAKKSADVLARLGIAVADSFVGCWNAKFEFDLLRPVTYIRRTIDPKWEAILNTPPFPEYPSGHSTQSGAAAVVLTHMFGENYAFDDATHERDGLPKRSFRSFWAAAEEAGISRLYGGIHFRAAIERGLDQGRCVGAFVNKLQTRSP
jgi:hypothetical protein